MEQLIPESIWLIRYDNALLDYEEKNNISSDELAILKPLKDILEYMNQFQLLPKTLSEPEKILELRKLLQVSSLSVIPKIPYNAAYRAQISNNVAVDAYVLYAWQCLCERKSLAWVFLARTWYSSFALCRLDNGRMGRFEFCWYLNRFCRRDFYSR